MKKSIIALALIVLGASAALAAEQTQIYVANTDASAANFAAPCFDSTPKANWSYTSGANTAPGLPTTRKGAHFHTASTMSTGTGWGCQLMSDSTTGQRWIVSVSYPSSNYATDLLVALSSPDSVLQSYPDGAVLANGSTTTAFAGAGASPNWGVVCYITPTTTHPTINFSYKSGVAGTLRFYADGIQFKPDLGCLATTAVQIGAPYVTNMTSFVVSNVTAGATALAVYKQMGTETKTLVGFKSSGIVAGNNTVPLLGGATLEKNVRIFATQTVGSVEGCDHAPDYYVGIGNSAVQFSFNMRASTSYAGPIGTSGTASAFSYYFLPGASGNAAGQPSAGVTITPSANWQTVTIDPRTATHGNVWSDQGYGPGDPWASGRPAWGAIDSFCFNMSDTNTGPYEVYIDNFANGATLIHDWENGTPNAYPGGLFATFAYEGTTSAMLTGTDAPLAMSTVSCGTNAAAPNLYEGGTNAQYVKWQWLSINTAGGVWLRKNCNVAGEATWASFPQIDFTKPITFDILLAPLGSTPHAVGTVTWMDDQTACVAAPLTLSVTAQGPGDPANYGQTLARSYTYQWSKNGTAIAGASGSATVGGTAPPAIIAHSFASLAATDSGTYSVVVNDGTASLTRSMVLSAQSSVSITALTGDPGPGIQVGYGPFPLAVTYVIPGACPCGNTPPVTYQWLKNGVALTGATDSSYTIAYPVALTDAGWYSVVVTNTCTLASATSTNVQLAVIDGSVTPVGAACGAPGAGLLGLYWTNQTSANAFTGVPTWTVANDGPVAFDWTTAGPVYDVYSPTDHFAIRWISQFTAPYDGTYTFYVRSDDGARLWVNGQLLVDKWVAQSATEWSGTIALTSANPVDLVLQYFENTGSASCQLSYSSDNIYKTVVPNGQLCAADPATGVPPLTTLTSPATAALGTPVTLTATVTPETSTVNSVQFFNGATPINSAVTTPPYTTTWTPSAVGVYNITAQTTYSASHVLNTPINKLNVIAPLATAVTITNIIGTTLTYGGGSGARFILLKSVTANAAMSAWTTTGLTNPSTPGSFTIPAVLPTDTELFYRIDSQSP
jgi:hypothetical protein